MSAVMAKSNGPTVIVHCKTYHLDRLSEAKLDHLVQLCDIEITNYERAMRNYPTDRMEKYGYPHLEYLRGIRAMVDEYRRDALKATTP